MEDAADTRPILIVPYMWIGDFVRGHTVVRVLKQRWPNRPVDLLVTSLCAPLVDYMPGVRAGIVWDLPRGRLAVAKQWGLASELRARGYGTALVLPRTWKAAIAPALAGIPERVGFFGEAPIRADQPDALGRKGPAPLHRQECRAGAACRRATAAGMAGAAARRAVGGNRALAAGQRPRHRSRGGAGARVRRRLQALDLLPRRRAAAGRARARRLGGRRPRREGAGAGDRCRRPRQGPRPHRAPTCATAFWRWRRPASPSRTIPA